MIFIFFQLTLLKSVTDSCRYLPHRVLVLVCLLCFSFTSGAILNDCSSVQRFFSLRNITLPLPKTPIKGGGGICGEEIGLSCCTMEMEAPLQEKVSEELQSLLHHNFQSIRGVLSTTATSLQDHVDALLNDTEIRTVRVFEEVYPKMAAGAGPPLSSLFSSLKEYFSGTLEEDSGSINLQRVVLRFFTDIFPLVYQQAIHHMDGGELTEEYKSCLRESIERVEPFGGHPREAAIDVARSLGSAKVLIESLSLGVEVLEGTDGLVSRESESCREALLRLHYCPRCLGLKAKPCSGYCLNVMRGCLTQGRATELDLPWSNFLEEAERLGDLLQAGTIRSSLAQLPSTVSEAIMTSTMEGPSLDQKVKKTCGSPKMIEEVKGGGGVPIGKRIEMDGRGRESEKSSIDLESQLSLFLETSSKARGFYANLAEALCSDESFAETRDTADCWNGHRIGEYTKALVRPGVDAQKYNPELKWKDLPPDPTIRQLSDRLRRMRQVVLSKVDWSKRSRLESESLVKEGSGGGSGGGPSRSGINGAGGWRPEDDEPEGGEWPDQGSGSGQPPIDTYGGGKAPDDGFRIKTPSDEVNNSIDGKQTSTGRKGTTAGASHTLPPVLLLITLTGLIPAVRWHH